MEMLETAIVCDGCVVERVYGDGREVDEIKSSEASGWRGMRVEDCACAAGGGPEKLMSCCCWGELCLVGARTQKPSHALGSEHWPHVTSLSHTAPAQPHRRCCGIGLGSTRRRHGIIVIGTSLDAVRSYPAGMIAVLMLLWTVYRFFVTCIYSKNHPTCPHNSNNTRIAEARSVVTLHCMHARLHAMGVDFPAHVARCMPGGCVR